MVPAIGRTECLRWCDPSTAGVSLRTSFISIQHRGCGRVLLSVHVSGSFNRPTNDAKNLRNSRYRQAK